MHHDTLNAIGKGIAKVKDTAGRIVWKCQAEDLSRKNAVVKIRKHHQFDLSGYKKMDEVPYDFIRKRLSILISKGDTPLMVTKWALSNVLAVCSSAEIAEGRIVDIDTVKKRVQQQFEEFSGKGFRTLGVAYKDGVSDTVISREQRNQHDVFGIFDSL